MAGATSVRARLRGADEGLPLRPADVVIVSLCAFAVAFLLAAGRWTDGFAKSALCFGLLGVGPVVFRALSRRFPRNPAWDFAATFWLLPVTILGHSHLGPIVDATQPELMDRYLAQADLHLFGLHPSVAAEAIAPAWLVEALMASYYTYFLLPVLLGVSLYARGDRRVLDEYVLALSLLYGANFLLYALVPAVGPRFFLAGEFAGPLQGVYLTPWLDSLMRQPLFMRDCFPSGHTAVALLVLTYAFRHARRLFVLLLPLGTGLVLATVVCRFHYAVDLLAAIPLVAACLSVAAMMRPRLEQARLARTRPEPTRA
ncbi:MAG: phosphatase PAP2 family protein [Myxococcales bacterium]|nr:phosphatase PAP2 family protein [Myxococcales bacterium]